MSEHLNDYYLELAAATPLPSVESLVNSNTLLAPPKVHTRSQTLARLSVTTPQVLSLQPSVAEKSKTKKRKPVFTIFVDRTAADNLALPLPKTPKRSRFSSPRTPLGERSSSANLTPRPSPRLPDTPYPLSPADPYWEDVENYAPATYVAPPEIRRGPPLPPITPDHSPLPHSARALRPRPLQSGRPWTLTPPINKLAYQMLGLERWNVSDNTIRQAYRNRAAALHPDKMPAREKKLATLDMQQLNAVKEMLLNPRDRRQYHMDGEIPWVI